MQHFKVNWKKVEVVTVPKPGKDPKIPQNRRPIILLSNMGQIYERILLNRLSSHVFISNLIPGKQFDFFVRLFYYSLVTETEYITSGLELKWTTVAVFLEISKAYDSTLHNLLSKLIQFKILCTSKIVRSQNGLKAFGVENHVSRCSTWLNTIPNTL